MKRILFPDTTNYMKSFNLDSIFMYVIQNDQHSQFPRVAYAFFPVAIWSLHLHRGEKKEAPRKNVNYQKSAYI